MAQIEAPPAVTAPSRLRPLAAFALLLPLLLLLRPYSGLVQDARIYVGRGLADLDPGGLGRDLVFADDAQTGFTLLRPLMRGLLAVASPATVSMGLVACGLLAWLAGALALAWRLAPGRRAVAAVVAMLALPADYGTQGTFAYAEAIATPRLFAEAAVLGGLAALLGRRRGTGLALLLFAVALHPLMALPGLAVGAALLLRDDRRWRVPLAVAALGGIVAGACGLPPLDRLFAVMDPDWAGIVRARSVNLFPTLWPGEAFALVACRAAAALLAGRRAGDAPVPARTLFWGGAGVALAGLLLSTLLGDRTMGVLVTQLQPWRALWLLAVLGNAGLALAAVALWRSGSGARLTLATLVGAWAAEPMPGIAVALALAAVVLDGLDRAGRLRAVTPRVAAVALVAALLLATVTALAGAVATVSLLMPLGVAWTAVGPWPYALGSGALGFPLVATAVVAALRPAPRRRALGVGLGAAGLLATLPALVVWDSRTDERRMVDARAGAAALDAALPQRPGGLLWIDEDSETWFLTRRPAFFNAVQGAPGLFSRSLAVEWAERARFLVALGLVRPGDVTLQASGDARRAAVRLTPEAVTRFCADNRRPAGLVAPGAQRDAVPPGLPARLWFPPARIWRLAAGPEGLSWRGIDVFTVVACAPPGPASPPRSP